MSTLTKKQLEDIISGLNGKLDGLERKLDNLESLPAKLAKMEKLLTKTNEENASLKKAMEHKEEEISSLKVKLNNLEQHNRSWSIRISNLPIPSELESNNEEVKKIAYNNLIQPILSGAAANGKIPSVPTMGNTIEYAHILPAKDGKPKPVIVRFRDRGVRDAVFANKRDCAPRSPARGADRPGGYLFPFFEDLTKINFAKMRAISAHDRVAACWSSRGTLKFKLVDCDSVKTVKNVFDPIEKIIN
jgi:hypothetical protein